MPRIKNHALKRLGEAIRKERKRQGISQENLALCSEVNRTYMGSVERGEVNISILTILRILDVLKVRPSQILKEADL
jgi:transcriptional regulator with XRE-family HTH domain